MKKMSLFVLSLLSVMTLGLASCGQESNTSAPTSQNGNSGNGNSNTSQGGEVVTDKEVESIAMDKLPTKTRYYVGETFSPDGGSILVTYVDKSTTSLSLTAEGVTLSAVNTSRVGEKTVTVTYQRKRTTFKIEVVNEGFKVTFDLNYDGGEDFTQDVTKNHAVEEPATPSMPGMSMKAARLFMTSTSPSPPT